MNRIAKFSPRLLSGIAYLGVVIGFLGMGYILYVLVVETWKLLFVAGTVPALAPVLPGIEIPGAPTLGFWHWVITIFIAAVVHEFSHGVVARLHDVKVKSSGFAFLGPILAAFVEPDEKQMVKKSKWKQLSVFAAGPFSNIILGILIILFTGLVFSPFVADIYQGEGITVNELIEGHPMEATGVALPFTITAINGEDTLDVVEFQTVLLSISPGEEAVLTTSEGEISLITTSNPSNEDLAFFGITGLEFEQSIAEGYEYIEPYTGILDWIGLLLLWLFIINIGIGLFNLLPLGPVDGGRMFHVLFLVVLKDEAKANKALGAVSLFVLGLIVINMVPWLTKFFAWIWSGLVFLIALI